MWTKKYIASVVLVTIITLGVGIVLWNSEEKQVLDPFEAWSRGPEDAQISIHHFVDFT